MQGIKTKREDLQLGMKLFRPVYIREDELLAIKGSIVTEEMLEWFAQYEIPYIYIEQAAVEQNLNEENLSYSQKIKNSQEFKEFRNKYNQTLECYISSLNAVVEHIAVEDNIKAMVKGVESLLNKQDGKIHVFCMLQNMRELDDSTYAHALNVAMIANIAGGWYGLPDEERDILTMCGLLHDVGKLTIPREILKKPGKLTSEEYAIIKGHCTQGYEIVKGLGLDKRIEMAITMHHERCDQSGYPKGLKGWQIDDFAKMITIVDVYDAMTASRVYRGPICPFHVVKHMEKEATKWYDWKFLHPFLLNVVRSYIGNTVLLSNGMRGEIILINEWALTAPMVKCGEKFLDLSKEKKIIIESII